MKPLAQNRPFDSIFANMPKPLKSPLGLAIKELGISTKDFCERLGMNYFTFMYQHRKGTFSIADIHRISDLTGKTFEELFPNPRARKKIPLNLAPVPLQSARVAKTNFVESVTLLDNPVQKEKGARRPPSSPLPPPAPEVTKNPPDDEGFQDPFEGGLPPVD